MATFSYIPSYTATENSAPAVRTVSFNEGYEKRLQFGLQRDPKSWNLSFANRDNTERDNIITFLEARKGLEAFNWTPPGESSSSKFICQSWSKSIPYLNRATIQATFEEVAEP